MATFKLAGVTFYDAPRNGGVGFFFSDMEDWYGVTPSKTPVNERAQADGAHGAEVILHQSAVISAKCFYSGSDRADMLRNQNVLLGALGSGRQVTATFTDELGPTSRLVSVENAKPSDTKGQSVVQFAIDLLARDPLKRLILGDDVLVYQLIRDPERRGRGALAHPGLQHPQLAALHGELDVT